MKKYSELGHVFRTEPCEEFPGKWICFFYSGEGLLSEVTFPSFEEAQEYASISQDVMINCEKISICWQCSDGDPRIGMTWFTGFYQHGFINQFGEYKS